MFSKEDVVNCPGNNRDDVLSDIISATESDNSRDKDFSIDDNTRSSSSNSKTDIEDIAEPEKNNDLRILQLNEDKSFIYL